MRFFCKAVSCLLLGVVAGAQDFINNEYVIKLKVSAADIDRRALERALGVEVKASHAGSGLILVRTKNNAGPKEQIDKIKSQDIVEVVEPNYIYRLATAVTDPEYKSQWALHNTGQADANNQRGNPGVDIQAEAAWEIERGSGRVIIGVVDSGVDYSHSDLRNNMWVNHTEATGQVGIDDDLNGYVDDIYGMNFTDPAQPTADPMDDIGHGTHCAGVIAAEPNNGVGISGVMWDAQIMPVKFIDNNKPATLMGAVMAIDYAVKMGARILSNSWIGKKDSIILSEAIQRANQANVLFVAAAGNDGENIDLSPAYPASYTHANVLTVAATDNLGLLPRFSNYGRRSVHVAAPGVSILSTVLKNQYEFKSGTSMATPHVAGVAGLLLSKEPQLSASEIKQRIIQTTKSVPALKNLMKSSGMISAAAVLLNELAPIDYENPENWRSQAMVLSSAHPYRPNAKETFEISVPGAKQIAIYFKKIETERGYDVIRIFDQSGALTAKISGKDLDLFSPIIQGGYARIEFVSDDTRESYGFDITKVAYR